MTNFDFEIESYESCCWHEGWFYGRMFLAEICQDPSDLGINGGRVISLAVSKSKEEIPNICYGYIQGLGRLKENKSLDFNYSRGFDFSNFEGDVLFQKEVDDRSERKPNIIQSKHILDLIKQLEAYKDTQYLLYEKSRADPNPFYGEFDY